MGHGGEKEQRRPASVYLAHVTLPAGTLLALILGTAQPSVAASRAGAKIARPGYLPRAARRYGHAVREGRAQPGGTDLSFFASLEAADPAPFAGAGVVEPAAAAAQ